MRGSYPHPGLKIAFVLICLIALVGAVSADTLVVYPSIDGYLRYYTYTGASFSTLHDAPSATSVTLTDTSGTSFYLGSHGTTSDYYVTLIRGGYIWNTSGIPDTAIISNVSFTFYPTSASDDWSSASYGITSFSPQSFSTIVENDYNNFDGTEYISRVNYTISYKDSNKTIFFNSNGISAINKTGYSAFMLRLGRDIDNSPPTWYAGYNEKLENRFTEYTGTGFDPHLTITYTTPDITPPASITGLTNSSGSCSELNFTWTNPTDADFNHTMYWWNGAYQGNLTNTTTSKLFTGLTEDTEYTISTKTVDYSWNENASFVNLSATTMACATPTPTPTPSPTSSPIPTPKQKQLPLQQWCGIQTLYPENESNGIAGYRKLINYPSGASEVDRAVIVNASADWVLVDSFITPLGLPNILEVRPGLRRYVTYHYTDSAAGTTVANFSVFKRNLYGTETHLYSVETVDIDELAIAEYTTNYVSTVNLALDYTDRFVVKVYGKTDRVPDTTLHFIYEGTDHYSHIETGYFECPVAGGGSGSGGGEAIGAAFGLIGGMIGALIFIRRYRKEDTI